MKILQVQIFDTKSCGPTEVMKQIIRRLNNSDVKMDVFSVRKYSNDKELLAKELGSRYFFTNGESVLSKEKIEKYVPNLNEYDLVHIHGIYEMNHYILANYLRKIGIPYVVSIHGNLMKSALKKSKIKKLIAFKLFIKRLLLNSTKIHVMAKNELEDVKQLIGDQDYQLIYNGVDFFSAGSNANKKDNDVLNILFVGRLDINHKGLDILLEAISSNVDKFRNKIKLYLVGPYNSNEDKMFIETILRKKPELNEIVTVEGPKYGDEKEKYYECCDVFIHTSRYEGMPVSVLEAMDRGLPCIVTPGTNMADIILECDGGIVTELNKDEIAKSIEAVLNISQNRLVDMGMSAQSACRLSFSWDNIAKQYKDMYRNIIENK